MSEGTRGKERRALRAKARRADPAYREREREYRQRARQRERDARQQNFDIDLVRISEALAQANPEAQIDLVRISKALARADAVRASRIATADPDECILRDLGARLDALYDAWIANGGAIRERCDA